jgi:hypothetical protein
MIRHRVTTAPVPPAAGTDTLDDTLREAAAPVAKVDAGDVASLPPKDGPEREVMTLRPSLIRSNPAVYLGLVLVMAVGALLAINARRLPASLLPPANISPQRRRRNLCTLSGFTASW